MGAAAREQRRGLAKHTGLHSQPAVRILKKHIKCCKTKIQHIDCMPRFTVRTADQLPTLLQAYRKEAGLTQAEVALRLGVTQQTYSALERNADTVGAARLLKLLNILGVELDLNKPSPPHLSTPGNPGASPGTDKPIW